ncbi:transketolase family protein [Candidatus Saccharibacteria bacterium]|nr:transketolase family protein [Candidatus Saccharibacteria bacterium]
MMQLANDFTQGNPVRQSLRHGFGQSLLELARQDERIVALSADLAGSVGLGDFVQEMGYRYVEVGVAEQNLVTVASGLAHMGKIPFAASYASFSPGRNWEQIRTSICLNNQPVKLIGSHAGLNVGADGASHQMLEDIALMRVLPGMVVLAPGDSIEVAQFTRLMAQDSHPCYMRLPRVDLPVYNDPANEYQIGRAYVLRQDDQPVVSVVTTGSMTGNALLAAQTLSQKGITSEVVHVPTIKPLDQATILGSIGRTKVVVTVEEHQVSGGLGSAIAELVLESDIRPTKFYRIGVNDRFGQSGTVTNLWRHYQLDAGGIVEQILALLDN